MTFATIQRSQPGGATTVTYTTNGLIAASYGKAYWSVDENVASCSVTGVSCSGTNIDCTHVGGAIRVVAYTPESGGAIITLANPQNTPADTNYDGIVSDSELLSYAGIWISGGILDSELLQVASAWLNS